MLSWLKTCVLGAAKTLRLEAVVLNSKWRRNRLCILCLHGVSTKDEHETFPGFFLPEANFRDKLELLRQLRVSVLPLAEGVARLANGTLPPRSVSLTIDDGFYGMYAKGRPLLRDYGFPVTVYMTTYYVNYNRPVFDIMCTYLLNKGAGRDLIWPDVINGPLTLDAHGRENAYRTICSHAVHKSLSGAAKDMLLSDLAARLNIDYEQLCASRLLHLMNPEELRDWSEARFELHTHIHRVSRRRERMEYLLDRNTAELEAIVGYKSTHFAYPGGLYFPETAEWLRDYGVNSAVTCDGGLATAGSDPLLLPRIMDTANLTVNDLRHWITGLRALLPARPNRLAIEHWDETDSI